MRTQALLKLILGVAFIALLLPIMSCDAAGNTAVLVGRWVQVAGDDKDVVIDLLRDGTGVVTKGSKGVAIMWKTESGRLYITTLGSAQSVSYKQQGSELTFTEDDGKFSKFTKCNKDCKEAIKEYAKAKAAEARVEVKAKAKKDSFTDSRDGKTYKTVKLDNLTWMSQNLNYDAKGSKCYDDKPENCKKYGRFYNWETAKSACPSGWRLPSNPEWQTLVDFVSGEEKIAGEMLKASSGWDDYEEKSGNGVDAVGFSALPGGYGNSNGDFDFVGKNGSWWSASTTNINDSMAYSRGIRNYDAGVFEYNDSKTLLISVRCVQPYERNSLKEVNIDLPKNAEWLGMPSEYQQSWGHLQIDNSVNGEPLTIAKKYYKKGIGTHASGTLRYNLNGKYERLTAILGLNEDEFCGDGVQIKIFGDDKLLEDTKKIVQGQEYPIDISLIEVRQLIFKMDSLGNKDCDHIDIAIPMLYH